MQQKAWRTTGAGQTQWWTVSACSCLSWKVPTAIWGPKCHQFIANILVSVLSTYIAVRFRKSSRNLDYWIPITCMAELCKAMVFSQAAQIISYHSVILRKRFDHEVIATTSFTWVYEEFHEIWQWINAFSGVPTYFILSSPGERQHVCFIMLFTSFLPCTFAYLLLCKVWQLVMDVPTMQARSFHLCC